MRLKVTKNKTNIQMGYAREKTRNWQKCHKYVNFFHIPYKDCYLSLVLYAVYVTLSVTYFNVNSTDRWMIGDVNLTCPWMIVHRFQTVD